MGEKHPRFDDVWARWCHVRGETLEYRNVTVRTYMGLVSLVKCLFQEIIQTFCFLI